MGLPSGRSADCTRRSYGEDEARNRRPGPGPAHRPAPVSGAPTPTPPRAPSGSTRPTRRRRARRSRATRRPISRSSAAASAASGPRCRRSRSTLTARSSCSRPSRSAYGATGRSGGFFSSSLTHGVGNGMSRFPGEMPLLERLGRQNFDRTVVALGQFEIDCDLELNGDLAVALEPHEERWLAEEAAQLARPRPRRRAPRPGCRARRARLPHLPRRPVAAQRRRDPRPGEARVGAGRRGRVARRAAARAHARFSTCVTRGARSRCARRAAWSARSRRCWQPARSARHCAPCAAGSSRSGTTCS